MRAQIRGLLLELDVLFGGYEMGTSPQKLYEGCDLGAIAGDVLVLLGGCCCVLVGRGSASTAITRKHSDRIALACGRSRVRRGGQRGVIATWPQKGLAAAFESETGASSGGKRFREETADRMSGGRRSAPAGDALGCRMSRRGEGEREGSTRTWPFFVFGPIL